MTKRYCRRHDDDTVNAVSTRRCTLNVSSSLVNLEKSILWGVIGEKKRSNSLVRLLLNKWWMLRTFRKYDSLTIILYLLMSVPVRSFALSFSFLVPSTSTKKNIIYIWATKPVRTRSNRTYSKKEFKISFFSSVMEISIEATSRAQSNLLYTIQFYDTSTT